MNKKPTSLFNYYHQNPQQFVLKTIYSRFCLIFWLMITITVYFIHPFFSLISIVLFGLFIIISRRHYYFNLKNNTKIEGVLETKFPNFLMSKEEIIHCFSNKRFVRLFQLLDQAENQNYLNHDFPSNQEDIDMLDEKERSYFDSIYIEIDEEKNSQTFYCMLWQERQYTKDDEDDIIGLTDVMILQNADYDALKHLIKPAKMKYKKTSSIVS